MLLADVEATKESDTRLEGALIVLENGLVGNLEVLTDDFAGGLLPHYKPENLTPMSFL